MTVPVSRPELPVAKTGWRPPAASRATRTWGLTSQASCRVSMAVVGDRLHEAESYGECKLLRVLAADPRVTDMQEQPTAVRHDIGGKDHAHVPDARVTLRDGRRVALDYRPECRAAPVRRLVRTLNATSHEAFEFRHVGDVMLPKALVRRAGLILLVRRDGPGVGDPAVARMREIIDVPMTIDEAVARSGDAGRGFRAIVHLIDVGALRIRDGYEIDYGETVEPVRDAGERPR